MSCVAEQRIRRLHLRQQFTSVFERLRQFVACLHRSGRHFTETPTRRPWNITIHYYYDNSPPVTCSGTRRQALNRRTWTVTSTTYRLLCGVLHTDRHAIIWRTLNFLRRPCPPRCARRRPALVFTDLSITLASRIMAIAGTAVRSSK